MSPARIYSCTLLLLAVSFTNARAQNTAASPAKSQQPEQASARQPHTATPNKSSHQDTSTTQPTQPVERTPSPCKPTVDATVWVKCEIAADGTVSHVQAYKVTDKDGHKIHNPESIPAYAVLEQCAVDTVKNHKYGPQPDTVDTKIRVNFRTHP